MSIFIEDKGVTSNQRNIWGQLPKHARVTFSLAPFVLVGVLLLLTSCSSGQSTPSTSEATVSDNTVSQREFPPFAYNSAQVLQAYETAVQIPEVLLLIPCYCNCGEAHDHKNLKDCFFKQDDSLNDHAAFCEVCDMEVADIAKWQEEGYSLEQIRGLIDDKYPRYGEPTDTTPFIQPEASPTPKLPRAGFTGEPRISFDEDSADMGKVGPEAPISYTFHFKNVGDKQLKIIDAWARVVQGC